MFLKFVDLNDKLIFDIFVMIDSIWIFYDS